MGDTQHISVGAIGLHKASDGSSWATLTIDRETNPAFCLALCLLDADLANTVRLVGAKNDMEIHVRKNAHLTEARGTATWSGKTCLLQITPDELGYWRRFFLEYWRDGIASVNHLDFESADRAFFLVLETDTAPMPPDELRRRFTAP